ncbi:hypothetical protein HZH66_001354 [Vespula vulgaris]|uniref:Uncharacterized protein n=1 Tax=Vespula vulgaris TaxID=7454 RepID=A0A834NLP2_VESVU|nr:hypothetical protein HZH66_001354 [Vespula vulgaris]
MEQETFVLFHVAGVTAKNEPVWSLALVYIKRRQVLSHAVALPPPLRIFNSLPVPSQARFMANGKRGKSLSPPLDAF